MILMIQKQLFKDVLSNSCYKNFGEITGKHLFRSYVTDCGHETSLSQESSKSSKSSTGFFFEVF